MAVQAVSFHSIASHPLALKYLELFSPDSTPAVGRAKLGKDDKETVELLQFPYPLLEDKKEKPKKPEITKKENVEETKKAKSKIKTPKQKAKQSSSRILSSGTSTESGAKLPAEKFYFDAYDNNDKEDDVHNENVEKRKLSRDPNTYKGPELDLPDDYDYAAIEQGEQIKVKCRN